MLGADVAPLEDSDAGGNARWRSEAERPGKTRVSGAWCTPGLAAEIPKKKHQDKTHLQ